MKITETEKEIEREKVRIKQDRQRLEKKITEDRDIVLTLTQLFERNIEIYQTKNKKYELANLIPQLRDLQSKY